jgi:hypothetical protein
MITFPDRTKPAGLTERSDEPLRSFNKTRFDMPYGLTCKLVNNRGSIGARIEIAVKKRSVILDIIREFFTQH